ncbi:MAG: RCC1 domain-containing protein, partial [Bacteroidales bacterium]|nr:RCC1 domain-containing protein [Bacteroidales bacterium]
MVLLGTKFFESGELNSKPDKKKSFKLTPFTTMAEMIHSGKVSNKEEYEETLTQIAKSLGTDLDTIQSDYNNTEGDNKDQNIAALLGGELMAALNMLPKTINEIATTKDKDEIIKITLKSLETIKELADGLKEKLLGIDGNIKNDIDLIEILNDKLKVLNSSFVSLSSGHADEWRCGVTKANEVWCWGNNAWNNLGNQEFTQNKLNVEKYSIANTDELMYLKNNYTAKPIPVLIKNPDKKTDEDPEYIHLSGITKVAVGTSHGCAITLNREVYCWGGNYHGQ